MNGMNRSEAVIEAGFKGAPCRIEATETFREFMLQNDISKEMQHIWREGSKATKTIQVGKNLYNEVPDHYIRHRFLETAIKVRGEFAPDKVETVFSHSDILDSLEESKIKT